MAGEKSGAGKSNSGMSTTCHLCQIIKPNLSINAQQHEAEMHNRKDSATTVFPNCLGVES